ncbi:MAG: hypothetical protein ACWGP1_16725, partial [Syntrophobacteria bacterium]
MPEKDPRYPTALKNTKGDSTGAWCQGFKCTTFYYATETAPRPHLFTASKYLARIFHELLSRDLEDGCATWQ